MFELTPAEKLLASLLLVGTLTAIRFALIRVIRKESMFITQQQRRWINFAKNGIFVLIVVGLIALWNAELRHFVLSITAFIIALVVATKELILCFSGSVLKTSSGAFAVGDWVEVGDVRGEVIDQNALTTTIQEVQGGNRYDYTGRTITLPNSVFLTGNVKNLNFMRRYVFHPFTITTPAGSDVGAIEALIVERATRYSEHFADIARRYNQVIEKRAGIDIAGPDPRVWVTTTNDGRTQFSTTLFCPTNEAVGIEQKIIRDVLERLRSPAPPATAPTGG